MALPILAGLAGAAGRAVLKKIAKKKAKKLTPPKTKKNPTKKDIAKDIKKAKDFKNSPEYAKAVEKMKQEMVNKTRKLGMTKKNSKASGEMFKKPGVSGGITKKKPGVSGGITKQIKPGVSGKITKKKPDFDKDKGVIRGKNPKGSTGNRNTRGGRSGESDTIRLSDEFNVDDFSFYNKGGKVKKMAYGGKVKKTGARRADGCAVRGKTKGRMI